MRYSRRTGFTIIELLVVVTVIAIVASLAVPRMLGAKLSANETAAVTVLRAIVASQMQAQTANSIDTDCDGLSEYCYLAELAGTVPARRCVAGAPAAGVPGLDELEPSPLVAALGAVSGSVVTRSGYVFQVWLADGSGAGIAEDPTGGKTAAPFPDPNNSENVWCVYGWPISAGSTGNKCFFANEAGLLLQTPNRGATPYSGLTGGPAFDAAFTVAGDMTSPVTCTVAAVDGNKWVPVQ